MSDVSRLWRRAGLYVCWHRSEHDGYDHAVTDEEFYRGKRALSKGRYEALCGHVVLTMSMLVPPGSPCSRCYAFLRARSTLPTVEQRMRPTRHRKRGVWQRLFKRPEPPVVPQVIPRQREALALGRGGRATVPGVGNAPTASVSAGRHALRGE